MTRTCYPIAMDIFGPAAIGAVAGYFYAKATPTADPISFALGGAATGLGASMAMREQTDMNQSIALGAATFSLIAYDRWHDGMWPFSDEARYRAAFG